MRTRVSNVERKRVSEYSGAHICDVFVPIHSQHTECAFQNK